MGAFNFKKSHFLKLQDYIQAGSTMELSEEDQSYLDILYLLNSMRRKYGRENAIAFIQHPPYNIPYRRSRQMFDEAINLFYLEDGIDKQAHRNVIYEELLAGAAVVKLTAKSAKDMEVFGDLVMKAYKAKGLDEPEPPHIPEALYNKPYKIYSLNPEMISLPKVSRNELAERIDNMEIPEREKRRVRQESGVEEVSFMELLDEQEEKIGSE